ncbi:hypothetical protein [Mariniphaga sediminis]|uniref:hypothetical protein n=1 Tax=Mariniphaga sediminis TaxID=1628158 RepID=UPI0035687818
MPVARTTWQLLTELSAFIRSTTPNHSPGELKSIDEGEAGTLEDSTSPGLLTKGSGKTRCSE